MSRLPYVLSGLLLSLALAGCSGSSGPDLPEEASFAEGTCRTAAADVRAIGRALPMLGEDGSVDAEVRVDLRAAHDRLRALADGAEADLQPALTELNEKIGIVRIRADGNSYEPALGELLTRSYENVVERCTATAG